MGRAHVDLLMTCSGTPPAYASVSPLEVGRWKLGVDEWAAFLALVEHHGMAPHVDAVIGSRSQLPISNSQLPNEITELLFPPADVGVSLARLHDESSRHSLLLTARLLKLLDLFAAAEIPVVTLKGPALSQQLYGDPGMRASVDLDLLVPPDSVEKAAEALQAHGYRLESSLAHLDVASLIRHCSELTFRGANGTGVDLHWTSAPADYPCQIPDDVLWSSLAFVTIAGRPVPVLAPECQLVYLCIHGARHCWTKLRWLCDVAMLIGDRGSGNGDRAPGIGDRGPGIGALDWEQVEQIAARSSATHALHLGLHLAQTLLRVELPAPVAARVAADGVIRRAAADVTRILTSGMPEQPPSSVQKTMFGARLAPSRRLAARHVAALMKAPTEADARRLKLPRALFFLYYPYRAARLASKYSQ